MLLKIIDRIQILSILPPKGDIRTLKIAVDIETKLTLSQEEIEKYEFNITEDKKSYQWNDLGKIEEKEFIFTNLELDEIKKALKNLESKQELTRSLMDLYFKFVENN